MTNGLADYKLEKIVNNFFCKGGAPSMRSALV